MREELQYKLETMEKMYREKDNEVHGLERKLRASERQVEELKETLRKGRSEKKHLAEYGQVKEDEHRVEIEKIRLEQNQLRV